MLLLGGAVGDRYGRRRAFIWGVGLFALASIACAASDSLGQLIAARAIQGVGAALLIPQGLSILSASFPEPERGRAIGTWSAWITVFAAIGPVVGGWLMQAWSWRLIFLLNLPLVLVILFLVPRIPESRAMGDGPARPLDHLGAALATLSFAAIIYALSFAPQLGWRNSPGSLASTLRNRPLRLLSPLASEPAQRDDAALSFPHPAFSRPKRAHISPLWGVGRHALRDPVLSDTSPALSSARGRRGLPAFHPDHVPIFRTGGRDGSQGG